MPANAHPEFIFAERTYNEAKTIEDKLKALEKMISFAPSHKGGENLRAQLKTRYKNLIEKQDKQKKSGKSSQQGIKKADMQAILVGPPNSGKSTLFEQLTNQTTLITSYPHSTSKPILGTIDYEDVKIQLIDTPSFPNTDKGLLHTTDILLLTIDNLDQIETSVKEIGPTNAKVLLVITKTDLLSEQEKRKLIANLKSKFKKFQFFLSEKNLKQEDMEELKKTLFKIFPVIRIYTKEPKKNPSKEPMILKKDSTLQEAAEKISKSLKNKIKFAKIWGPSSKFPGQMIGLNHVLKDKDIIEIKTN